MESKNTTEDRSKLLLAVLLIFFGLLWLLKILGVHLHMENLFHPLQLIFSRLGRVIFSWPMILVLVGLILLAGKRSGGWILIVLGGIFLLPRIFHIPGFSLSVIAPLILIIAGAALIIKRV